MRRRHHHAAFELQLPDGEVDHLRSDQAQIRHIRAGVGRASHHGFRHGGRGQPHVAPDGDGARLELLHVRAPDRVRAGLVELVGIDPAYVVGLEHLGVEHGRDASGSGNPTGFRGVSAG